MEILSFFKPNPQYTEERKILERKVAFMGYIGYVVRKSYNHTTTPALSHHL